VSGEAAFEYFGKGHEFDPQSLAPGAEFDEVQSALSALAFADLALGHSQLVGQIDLS
jgi:hypothetical protein